MRDALPKRLAPRRRTGEAIRGIRTKSEHSWRQPSPRLGPPPSDDVGWSEVVSDPTRLARCPPGVAVAALRALYASGDQRVGDALTSYVSKKIIARLRRKVSSRHPNRGEDMIEAAHDALLDKVLDPGAPEGNEIAAHFEERLHFHAIDAIRVGLRRAGREIAHPMGEDGEPLIPEDRRVDGGAGVVPIGVLLARVPDPRKRLAFRLHMEGMRVRAGRPCVATVLGVDPKTAAKWIDEARAILRDNIIGA